MFEWVKNHGGEPIIPFSGVFESKLVDMPEDERDKYCKEVGAQSAIDKIVTTGFRAIQLIYFFTAGADEVKCWQIRKHTKAPQVCTPFLQYLEFMIAFTVEHLQAYSSSFAIILYSVWIMAMSVTWAEGGRSLHCCQGVIRH